MIEVTSDQIDPTATVEDEVSAVGIALADSLNAVLDQIPGSPHRPQHLARRLGVDKVLTSRLLKAARNRDPIAVTHLVPGPDPLRRVLRAATKHGVDSALVQRAEEAIGRFESLIRREAGDRSALDAMISAWLPEVRREFELRRKQAAFKAMSHLKGSSADVNLATCLLHPADDGRTLDVVWLFGMFGLQRLRPGVVVKFASRLMDTPEGRRRPTTLDRKPIEDLSGIRLEEYCNPPSPPLDVHPTGTVMHYTLGGSDFGPNSAIDLVFAEANFAEMDRYVRRDRPRKGYVFAEIGTPSKTLLFDVLVHEAVYPDSDPQLAIYDTALDGVANVNDSSRDIDRLDLLESISALGKGVARCRSADIPKYIPMLRDVCARLGWDESTFRAYRCRIDYPIYGSQIAMMFSPPADPHSA